jgi:hypothetical protein
MNHARDESLVENLFQEGLAVTSHGVSERPVHLLHATNPLWWTKVVIPESNMLAVQLLKITRSSKLPNHMHNTFSKSRRSTSSEGVVFQTSLRPL